MMRANVHKETLPAGICREETLKQKIFPLL
jgi:hypothetical protein